MPATHKANGSASQTEQPDTLAVLSIVFGVVSLLGPGLLLGIPAIIMAGIALKKDLAGRGLSIAGLVTGIISTVLSLVFIAFIALLFSWAISNSDTFYDDYYYPKYEDAPAHQGSRT